MQEHRNSNAITDQISLSELYAKRNIKKASKRMPIDELLNTLQTFE
jgi:hypothetical protein